MSRNLRSRGVAGTVLLVSLLAVATGCGGSESRKARHVQQGQQFMAERNYTKARIEYRNALQIDPKDAEVRSMVGFTSEKLGEYDDAVKAYRIALAANEDLVMARARLARIMAVAGLPEEALELLEPGLERTPQSAQLLSVRAVVRGQQGDLPAARKDADQAFALDPKDPDVVATLASFKWQEGEREETIALLRGSIEATPAEVDLRLLLARLLLALDRRAEAEQELIEVVRLDPRRIDYRSLLAQVYVQQGNADQAIETVREAVQANPESVETKLALAQLLAVHRSVDEAVSQMETFRGESPKDYALQLAIADFYARNARTTQAEGVYHAVIDAAGDQAQGAAARTQLAALQMRAGRLDEASKLVGQVLAENPADADALATRADIALTRGDTPAAVTDLRTAFSNEPDSVPIAVGLSKAYAKAGQMELAEQTLRSVVQASPRNADARFALARFLVDTGRPQQARPVLEQLVADQPGNVRAMEQLARLQISSRNPEDALGTATAIQSIQPSSAAGFQLGGMALQAMGRLPEARQSFETAAANDPEAIDPIVALVALDLKEQGPERALDEIRKRVVKDPQNAVLLALQGDLLLQMKKPEEAAASYAAATKLNSSWSLPYRGQANALVAAGRADQAVKALESGLIATSEFGAIASDLLLLYVRLGRTEDAISVAERTLKSDPMDNSAANNLALLLANYRDDEKSLERAEALTRQFAESTNPSFLDTYGWVLYKRGRFDEAVRVLERAVSLSPDRPELRYHLGMAQLKLGQKDKAKQSLQAAVSFGTRFEGADEARAVLAGL